MILWYESFGAVSVFTPQHHPLLSFVAKDDLILEPNYLLGEELDLFKDDF